ncbi:hypothetical protein [Shewanella putrefaciens]|uniref:hypothetical protein n=1 Tax=Shewanella putrefaciens TaxID=24 RepID=UPI00285836D8|nr:hypothetical protein [Shewanella putrefaciens]MDR6962512.1 hypothetical protein [Shewanella putrefaciens]
MLWFTESADYADAQKANHGDGRDDRPPHGRGGRASTDGLAACRRVSTMVGFTTMSGILQKLATIQRNSI